MNEELMKQENEVEEITIDEIEGLEEIICPGNGGICCC